MIGFETIGNATLTCIDGDPVVVTDPWIEGYAYFGSWGLPHDIPEEQKRNILAAPYAWMSHGHPDHMNPDSMSLLKGKTMLLPDHVGGRIADGLRKKGFEVKVLTDNKWYKLSENIRVMSLADYNQDAVFIADIAGKLVVNFNDCSALGWERVIRKLVESYDDTFMLRLFTHGGVDMMNFFDERGNRIAKKIFKKTSYHLGEPISRMAEWYGFNHVIPFSSFHRISRTDSAWVKEYEDDIAEFGRGYTAKAKLFPAFIKYDVTKKYYEPIVVSPIVGVLHEPEHFGDNWSESLEKDEVQKIKKYFQRFEHLKSYLDYIQIKVGGETHSIDLSPQKKFNKGITFEAPRHSLMTSIDYEIFDDLLIGNFMKATLHGNWGEELLYPNFTPYIAKYGDNGMAWSNDEVEEYFRTYKNRIGFIDWTLHHMESKSKDFVRSCAKDHFGSDSMLFKGAKKAYYTVKQLT